MGGTARRVGCVFAFGVLSLGMIAAAPLFGAGAQAQTTIVDPNAPKAGQSSHDAAIAAAARRDYVTALELSKKAAAEGQPLEADQVEFISGKAAQQQALADEAARTKAQQVAAQDQAHKIEARQQKDYAERAQRAADRKAQCGQQTMAATSFTNAYAAAQSNGLGSLGQGAAGGMASAVPAQSPITNERPASC